MVEEQNTSTEYVKFLNWANHAPVVTDDNETTIYLTDDIESPGLYNEVVHKLYTAKEDESITIVANNGGGSVNAAIMIMDAIDRSAATVVVLVAGFVASATTMIALSGDELVINDHSTWMVHNYSTTISGKGNEVKSRQEFMDRHLNKTFSSLYKGFLTDEEMLSVIDGDDMWMDAEEVRERWEKRKEFLAKENT